MATKNEILGRLDNISARQQSGVRIKGTLQVGVFDFQKFLGELVDIVLDVIDHAPASSPGNLPVTLATNFANDLRLRATTEVRVLGVEQKGPITPNTVRTGELDALMDLVADAFNSTELSDELTDQDRRNGSVKTGIRTLRGTQGRRARTYSDERDLALSRLRELVEAEL